MTESSYDGVFIPSEGGAAHLKVAGRETELRVVFDKWRPKNRDALDVFGTTSRNTKTSLLRCVNFGSSSFVGEANTRVSETFFPHLIAFGNDFISSSDRTVIEIGYSYEHAEILVPDFDTFDTIHCTSEELYEMISASEKRTRQIFVENELDYDPKEIKVGDHPIIAYFTGNHDAVRVETSDSEIVLSHRVGSRSASTRGVSLDNTIWHELKFKEKKTVDEALMALSSLHRLFQISLGQPHKHLEIEFRVEGQTKFDQPFRLIWCYAHDDVETPTELPHPLELPFDPVRDPFEFQSLVQHWVSTQSTMEHVRRQICSNFFTNVFSPDRLVSAANAFDLLPENYFPPKGRVEKDAENAIDQARLLFKTLPESSVRHDILVALKKAGKLSLRDRTIIRAKSASQSLGRPFENLELVCREAILCRNHFVHGSKPSFDYDANFGAFSFLVKTLEFVFLVSDLSDGGWNGRNYIRNGTTFGHPFSRYIHNYDANIKNLNELLAS